MSDKKDNLNEIILICSLLPTFLSLNDLRKHFDSCFDEQEICLLDEIVQEYYNHLRRTNTYNESFIEFIKQKIKEWE